MPHLFRKAMLYRDGKLFIKALCYAVVLTALFGVLCGAAVFGGLNYTESGNVPLSVSFYDGQDTFFSRMVTSIISGNEGLSSVMSMTPAEKDEVIDGTKSGKYAAGLVLPEGWLDKLTSGTKGGGTVYIGDSVKNQEKIARYIANAGGALISIGQYGVFAGLDAVREDYPQYYGEYLLSSNDALLNESMSGMNKYFEDSELSYSSARLSVGGHYAALLLAAILELSGLFFYRAVCTDLPIYERLLSAGVKPYQFLSSKILYGFLFRALILAPVLIFAKASLYGILLALYGVLLLAAVSVSLSVLLSGGRYAGAVMSGISAVSLFLCGAVVPISMMPKAVLTAGAYTPLGAMYQMLSPALGGECAPASAAALTLLAALMLFVSARALRKGGAEI